jgi:hypothetical protein
MKEAPGSSETSVLTRATRRNNPEDTILQLKITFSGALNLYWHFRIPLGPIRPTNSRSLFNYSQADGKKEHWITIR